MNPHLLAFYYVNHPETVVWELRDGTGPAWPVLLTVGRKCKRAAGSGSSASEEMVVGRRRKYSLDELRGAARHVVEARQRGESPGLRSVAEARGFPSMRSSLGRLLKKAREAAPASFHEQLAFVDVYEFPTMGCADFALRRMFSDDELDDFAEVLKYSCSSGFPFSIEGARGLMLAAVEAS